MIDPLRPCRAKINRAVELFDGLAAEIASYNGRYHKGEAYDISRAIDAETGEEVHRLKVLAQLPLIEWSIASGLVAHLCRSALDNLVEVLTEAHSGRCFFDTEFPVFDTACDFGKLTRKREPAKTSGIYKIRGIAPAAAKIIEELQPYNAGERLTHSTLWVLHRLSNIDKHRAPAVMGTAALVGNITIASGLDRNAFGVLGVIAYDDGTEVARFDPPPSGQPEMDVDLKLDVQIAFDGGPADGRQITKVLRLIIAHTTSAVDSLAPFAR